MRLKAVCYVVAYVLFLYLATGCQVAENTCEVSWQLQAGASGELMMEWECEEQ